MEGILTALITPFDEKENLNLSMLKSVMEFDKNRGVSSFWVLGTSGEFNMLSLDEKISVVKTARESVNSKILAGINENSLKNSDILLKNFVDFGVDGVFSIPPLYHKPNDKGIIQFYENLSKPGLPVYIYNIPSYVGYNISLDILTKLVDDGIIDGMKYTTSDMDSFIKYTMVLKEMNKDFNMLIGSDTLVLPALMYGADGAVSGIANFAPEIISSIYTKYKEGDFKEAYKYQLVAIKLNNAVSLSDYPTGIKIALRYRGLYVGKSRSPLQENISAEASIYDTMKEFNL
ncbi:dihydrodipicolinate synthase family protein [Acidianus brierleyi]|uniref:Dihydrodipicolinate synthase family protein n=1 Tax=Acidianus brierleyi TaxID=41673 RepID=A0A2U9IEZ7_9CREN|nr:dihydrodipicolinate synthase family protein [Acidianus brierleyi]AWR94612.1 dihydrodipicolinate synthase family protein [Acidianus brierleyi]